MVNDTDSEPLLVEASEDLGPEDVTVDLPTLKNC